MSSLPHIPTYVNALSLKKNRVDARLSLDGRFSSQVH